jgi:hypothetical protein
MESSRIPSPLRHWTHRVAKSGGMTALIGFGGATLIVVGVALDVTGTGHVFPGHPTATVPASGVADSVLAAPEATTRLLPGRVLLVADPATAGPPMAPGPAQNPNTAAPRNVAAANPVKRPDAPPAHPAPAKSLIPPASLPAKLSPPPAPRPALPIDTDLQPLASPTPQPPSAPPPATAKPLSG